MWMSDVEAVVVRACETCAAGLSSVTGGSSGG